MKITQKYSIDKNPNNSSDVFAYNSLESLRKKLLDLSSKNPLLNYKHPKVSCIRLIDELPNQIFDELKDDKSLTFIPVPEPTEEELVESGYIKVDLEEGYKKIKEHPSAKDWAKHLGFDVSFDLPEEAILNEGKSCHVDSNLQTLLYAPELESHLRSIQRKANTALEEGGANVLFLSIGQLEWFESRDSDIKRMAPLFNVPVELERSKKTTDEGVYRYTIKYKDDGLITNITLREKLSNDFGLILPDIEDCHSPEEYFELIKEKIIPNQPKWKVRRQITLSLLNYTKQVMFQDLDPNNWPEGFKIEEHPLISKFFGSDDVNSDMPFSPEEEYSIDDIQNIHDSFPLIYEADSSQHSALIDAVKGKNLVIEGPPGTGKSQTITNLIAASISNGKRVLFVAEKMAALRVVKDRLDKAGLGDLCLELHSHRTNKQKILSDLGNSLNKNSEKTKPIGFTADIQRFEDLKCKLKEYVELINRKWGNTGLTIHEILNKATRYREQLKLNPNHLKIEGINGNNLTQVRQREFIDNADMLSNIYRQVSEQTENGNIIYHYWYGVMKTDLLEYQTDSLFESLFLWNKALSEISVYWKHVESTLALGVNDHSFNKIESIVKQVRSLPDLVGGELFDQLYYLVEKCDVFEDWLIEYKNIHQRNVILSETIKPNEIYDKETIKKLNNSIEIFIKLGFSETETLNNLASYFSEMLVAEKQLVNIEKQLTKVKSNFPDTLGDCFISSIQGFNEYNVFIKLISKLPNELWRFRDEIYDNPDIDVVLEILTKELNWLNPLFDKLVEHFNINSLPISEDLKNIFLTLSNGGFFCFFSSNWRKARKDLISLSTSPNPKVKNLLVMMPDLIKYSEGIEELDRINKEEKILADIYKGIKTPIERINKLRSWYKDIRTEYGFGFGDRVSIGSALLNLDSKLALSIKDFSDQGLSESIQLIIKLISNLTQKFSLFMPLRNDQVKIKDILSELIQIINPTLISLKSILIGEDQNINKLIEIKKILIAQQDSVNSWKRNILTEVLSKKLPLSINVKEFSNKQFSIGNNTLSIAKILKNSPEILNSIVVKPVKDRYIEIKDCVEIIENHRNKCFELRKSFIKNGEIQIDEWEKPSNGLVDELINRNKKALDNKNWLNTWLDYILLRDKLHSKGLSNIICELELKKISIDNIQSIVKLAIYHQLADEIFEKEKSLYLFNGMEQVAIREKFKEYDRKLLSLQRELISFKASKSSVPNGISSGKISEYTEASLIRHNLNLKRPKIAVRSLIKRSSNAIQALKPCFMMSPMSVAQYLVPGKFHFDLVIMDEASQIRPEDALGSIARGKNLVVVGDPKQLPPTSFFLKVIENEDSDELIALEESESILDAVSPMFSNRQLRWHYRSRHESLISFSNHKFYNNNLVIFPSPNKDSTDLGIRYKYIEQGRFVNRRNVNEAKSVVEDATNILISQFSKLRKFLKTEDKKILDSIETIGIVSMNSEQQDEILRQFELVEKNNHIVREAKEILEKIGESVFVKNLENVQGDERDIILISMTYGPEKVGAESMHQRFGPINSDVGWRRLNVLFTRAKKRMHIHSSMNAGHIRTSESSSLGVNALKGFLKYCETGSIQQYEHTGRSADSDFEIAVMGALTDNGFECEPQLGVAGFFLDIAVKDPGMPGRFLMGIECDGASYHSAKSTRDRDRLRQEILENLGWNIRRIWSTDWFKNPKAQLQPILNELELLRTKVKVSQSVKKTVYDIKIPVENKMNEFYGYEEIDLRSRLLKYDNYIRTQSKVDDNKRLLRPAMLEALLNIQPCSKAEFLETVPSYLRNGTDPNEGKYIAHVLEIISSYGNK